MKKENIGKLDVTRQARAVRQNAYVNIVAGSLAGWLARLVLGTIVTKVKR